jgi:hypothetical protein
MALPKCKRKIAPTKMPVGNPQAASSTRAPRLSCLRPLPGACQRRALAGCEQPHACSDCSARPPTPPLEVESKRIDPDPRTPCLLRQLKSLHVPRHRVHLVHTRRACRENAEDRTQEPAAAAELRPRLRRHPKLFRNLRQPLPQRLLAAGPRRTKASLRRSLTGPVYGVFPGCIRRVPGVYPMLMLKTSMFTALS